MNDTTRELGGALGIAVLGSIATGAYRAAVDLGGLGLASAARAQGGESIGAAAQIAARVQGGGAVRTRAAAAFTHAFNTTSVVSIVIVAAAAVAVLVLARPTGTDTVDDAAADVRADGLEFEFALAATAGEPAE